MKKKTKSTQIPDVVSTQKFNTAYEVTETTGITKFKWMHGDLHDVRTKIYYSLFVIVSFFAYFFNIEKGSKRMGKGSLTFILNRLN